MAQQRTPPPPTLDVQLHAHTASSSGEASAALPLESLIHGATGARPSAEAFTSPPRYPVPAADSAVTVAGAAALPANEAAAGKSRGRGRPSRPKVEDLQEVLEQKLSEYKQLADQNAYLRNKLQLLEKVVPLKDESMGFLAHANGVAAAAAAAAATSSRSGAAGAAAATAACSKPHLDYCPTVQGRVPAITPAAIEQLRGITPRQLQELWSKVVSEMGKLVLCAEAHGTSSPQHQHMETYLANMLQYFDRIMMLAPETYFKSMYVNVETGAEERPPDQFWANVGRSLGLTPEQQSQAQSVMSEFARGNAPVVAERRLLNEQLASAMAPGPGPQHGLAEAPDVEELTMKLTKNVIKEYCTHWKVMDMMCYGLLTPYQVAKGMVVSYPFIPDDVAIMHAVMAEHAPAP